MTNEIIKRNKLVEFTYRICDPDGRVVEEIEQPVKYIHGRQSGMHEKIERELAGRRAGDTISVALSPEEGFGQPDSTLIFTDDVNNVPPQYRWVGAQVDFHNDAGESKAFRVIHIDAGRLTFDGNHPLAGVAITFYLNILSVRDATPGELSDSGPAGQLGEPGAAPPRILN